jgi:hypothetical protein
MGQFGAGFTLSETYRVYLEGSVGYSHYDPEFVATRGQSERRLPTEWISASGTGGVGWDFPIIGDLKFRPIFNFSLGHVASSSAAGRLLQLRTGRVHTSAMSLIVTRVRLVARYLFGENVSGVSGGLALSMFY